MSGFDKQFTVGPPAGFRVSAPACPGVVTGQPHDGVALRLVIRVPTNANSFSVKENFFTYEFPNFVCSTFNDWFVILMTPMLAGLPNANIAFDQDGNPISVNNSLLQVCDPQDAGGKTFPCPLGSAALAGTGFGQDMGLENHAATGWLKTIVNVEPSLKGQDITLFFGVGLERWALRHHDSGRRLRVVDPAGAERPRRGTDHATAEPVMAGPRRAARLEEARRMRSSGSDRRRLWVPLAAMGSAASVVPACARGVDTLDPLEGVEGGVITTDASGDDGGVAADGRSGPGQDDRRAAGAMGCSNMVDDPPLPLELSLCGTP
jgi:hypothetical protein